MNTIIKEDHNPIIIYINGRIDTTNADIFEIKLQNVILYKDKDLAFDFSELEYISSSGLRVLMLIINEFSAHNSTIGIIAPNEIITEIFEISGLIELVKVFNNENEAIEFYQK